MTDGLAGLLRERYGDAFRLQRLDGELDENFLAEPARPGAPKTIFKLMRPGCAPEFVALQIEALNHLRRSPVGQLVPQVLPTLEGGGFFETKVNGTPRIGWMISRLPGVLLSARGRMHARLAQGIGESFGRLDRALEGFDHPLLSRPLKWDLRAAGWIQAHVGLFEDPQRRSIVGRIAEAFGSTLAPRLDALPQAVLHNDGNDANLFLDEDDRLCGIIDFGDMVRSARIAEVAIASAYVLMYAEDPLHCAAAALRGYHLAHPLTEAEIEAFWPSLLTRLAVSVTNAELSRREHPENPYLQVSMRPAWSLLFRFHDVDADALSARLQEACQARTMPASPVASRLTRRSRHFASNQRLSYHEPLLAVRGERHFLFDRFGRRYLDAYNNVPHVGHAHPHVAEAVSRQLGQLNTNSRYLTDEMLDYAEALSARLPDPLSQVFLVNSASEANEVALRLARAATGAKDMVVLEHGYHGCTTGALDISPYKYAHPTLHGAPDWVHEVPQPDLYRGRFWRSHPGDTAPYLSALDQILESIAALGRGVAGFICECLPSVGGQIVLPPGYLRSAYARVRGAGGVCIADDVQTGLGRLGGSFWGFEPQEVVPDIVVLGKPLGNGYPLAAAVTTPAIAEAFAEGPEFFSTFGGSSASCAAGRAVLEVLKREDLPARAKSVGQQLSDGFRALAGAHPSIGEVRGMGLFWGLEMVSSRAERTPDAARAASLKRALYERHILIGTDGPDDNVLKIRPPMTFDHEAAAHLLSVLSDVLDTSAP